MAGFSSSSFSSDRVVPEGGYRTKAGDWAPSKPVEYAPILKFPLNIKNIFKWMFAYPGYLWPFNVIYFGIVLLTWNYFQPPVEKFVTLEIGVISKILMRNFALLWIWYGGWHLYLYTWKMRGQRRKYCARWQSTKGSTFLLKNQVYDNIFWCCASGCVAWTFYEVLYYWSMANGYTPMITFKDNPIWFISQLLLIPIWREFHFYWIHRFLHWKPLYKISHYLHHHNINPGPWSGLAMHPIESMGYFSVVLIHFLVPSHPLLFLFNSQHTALTPAPSHTGFEGSLKGGLPFGSYFHYLHHRYFDCNYGESGLPFDKWFGSFMDGQKDIDAARYPKTYLTYEVIRIEQESERVKSFYLKREDRGEIAPHQSGQHLLFRVPVSKGKVLRCYSISDSFNHESLRVSIKKEFPPIGSPDLPPGEVSSYFHDEIKVGDTVEAKGPRGDFVLSNDMAPVFLAAGGVGITPIIAMAKDLVLEGSREVTMFVLMKNSREFPFQDELLKMKNESSNLRVFVGFDEPLEEDCLGKSHDFEGYFSREWLEEVSYEKTSKAGNLEHYICGPKGMMESSIKILKTFGVEDHKIHMEVFSTSVKHENEENSDVMEGGQVEFIHSEKTIKWTPEDGTLLELAESNDIEMEAGCLFGECGSCKVNLKEGEVVYDHPVAATVEKGTCLPCSCRPKGSIVIEA